MSLLYMEHCEFYKRKYGSNKQDHDGASSASSVEILDLTESEMELLCGEEVSEQTEQSVVETTLHKEADALVDKWLALRIEWAKVDKKQYPKNEEGTARLCQYINIRQWCLETDEHSFPTIAMLARVWLGRCSSTAFQERVFSTGSFVMSPLRTRTSDERAHRQLILHHSRQEIERLEESSRNLW
ncbi:hypothetical protein GQ600_357 [Phytophthora cactorum]|nr:hypothetical protein GQ600_357 [Phytophthora cactorum]